MQKVIPALDAFAKCKQKRHKDKTRQKRFIDPFSLTVIALGVVVGSLGSYIWSWFSPDSSYNRINEMEKRGKEREAAQKLKEEERDRQIAALEEALEEALHKLQETVNRTLEVVDQLSKDVTKNTRAIGHLAKLIPAVSLSAADIKFDIREEAKMLTR